MASGAFLYDHGDIALGGGAGGLALNRSYNSANNTIDSVLGHGWSHNYDLSAEVHSSTEFGLGRRLPVDAAAVIAADIALLDLMSGNPDLKAWTVAALIGTWGMDQLTRNAISLHLGTDILTYIKLPDGSYSLPPGVSSLLINSGGLFSIQERFGRGITFNADNKASQITDADGNHVTFSYAGGKLQTVADDFNHSLAFNYTGERLTSVTDSAGRTVSFGFDANNDLTTYTDPEAKIWRYTYDGSHRLQTLQTPLGITTVTNTYDSLGHVMQQEVPRQSGNVLYKLYFSGYRNIEEDASGKQTVYHFDGKKRLYAVQDALGHLTQRFYDGQNHVTATIDVRNNNTRYQYDGANNLKKIIDADNKETTNTYDALHRLTDITDPLGHLRHNDYDDEHHPIKTTLYPNTYTTVSTSEGYYANGLLNTSMEGRGTVTTMTYDSFGNPATSKTASHPAVTYSYDSIGRMTGLTDQTGAQTAFAYDKRGLLTKKTDPLNRDTVFSYYADGSLQTKTDRNNKTITYDYTPSGKLATITYPDNSTTSYTYDLLDNLRQRQDNMGTTTFAYDAANRLTSLTDANGFTTGYQYDEAGNLTLLTYPDGKTVTYTYDDVNRLATVRADWLDKTATYSYDSAGRLTGLSQFNATRTSYGYDNANRLTDLYNLTAAYATIATYHFTLDANGNRKTTTQDVPLGPVRIDGSQSLTYNGKYNRLLNAGPNSFTYDNEGQLATGYGKAYSFDDEHRLTAIGSDAFAYDGAGNRLTVTRGGVTSKYIYDASGNLIAEADANNVISRYYIHGAGLLAMATPAGDLYCYHFDATGHTVALTDANQTMVNKYAYQPFGLLFQEQEAIPQPFKYVGQFGVMAEPNGFYYMRARYYDPKVRRFISEDPLGFDGGDVNLYAYVQNNPVNFIDPLGLEKQFGFNITGTVFAQGGGGGGLGVGISTNGTLSGTQFYIQTQAAAMAGAGYYAGVGASGSVGTTEGPLPTLSTSTAWHSETGYGTGPSVGVSGDYASGGASASLGVRPSVGFGVMAGTGISTTSTIATPTFGQMFGSSSSSCGR